MLLLFPVKMRQVQSRCNRLRCFEALLNHIPSFHCPFLFSSILYKRHQLQNPLTKNEKNLIFFQKNRHILSMTVSLLPVPSFLFYCDLNFLNSFCQINKHRLERAPKIIPAICTSGYNYVFTFPCCSSHRMLAVIHQADLALRNFIF